MFKLDPTLFSNSYGPIVKYNIYVRSGLFNWEVKEKALLSRSLFVDLISSKTRTEMIQIVIWRENIIKPWKTSRSIIWLLSKMLLYRSAQEIRVWLVDFDCVIWFWDVPTIDDTSSSQISVLIGNETGCFNDSDSKPVCNGPLSPSTTYR